MGPFSSLACSRELSAVLASSEVPRLALSVHLTPLGVCLTSEHRDVPIVG